MGDHVNWVPVVQASIAGAVFVWGLPVAWQHWSWERRLVASIERNGKAVAASNSPTVKRVLAADSEQLAWRLAAAREVKWPWGFWMMFWVAWFGVSALVLALLLTGSQGISWLLILLTVSAAGWVTRQTTVVRKSRKCWIDARA